MVSCVGVNDELEKHVGERITFGHRRPNGVFFDGGILKAVSSTHIFVLTSRGEQAFLIVELSKLEFNSEPKLSHRHGGRG